MKLNMLLAHGAAWSLLLSASVAFGDSCVTATCHVAIAGLKNQHQPVKDGDCFSCHRQKAGEHPLKGGKSFELTAKGAVVCYQCHDSKRNKNVVHSPVGDGDCITCHKPHGAAGRFLLDVNEDQKELCLDCHDRAPFNLKFLHGPAAVGECTKCHDPHQAAAKALINGPVRDLCLKCHADFAETLNSAQVVHPPVKNDPCTDCHNPHGSSVLSILNDKMPDLCVGCHKEVGRKLAGVKVPHKPLLQEAGCGSCHSAHYSTAKGLLPFDEMTTCLSCHGKDNLGKPPLRNIKKDLAGKKYLHGPVAKGACTACHDPHGSDFFRMLRGNYPTDLYAPSKEGFYDACLACHDKDLFRLAESREHTNFRNGDSNLHFVHVSGRKGRTCRICHEPHASDQPRLINKKGYQFGEWNIPLNFTITSTGGSCAPGCHRAFKYDREKPVSY